MQNLPPLFRENDSINYLGYASLYLEQMRKLPIYHPEIHVVLMSGHFVVQQINGSFNAVSPDMKLEQSIQRSQKSVHGIIGQTRKSKYATEWEVAYHEILSINNVFRTLTCSNLGSRESYLHHELVGNYSKIYNSHLLQAYEFLESRGNPYDLEINYNSQLYNTATGAVVPCSTAEKLLCFYNYGKEKYIEFRTNRSVQKEASFSSTMKKIHMPNFLTHLKNKEKTKTKSSKFSTKQLSASHKSFEVAHSRGILIAEILQYDLFPTNILFDDDYTFKLDKATSVKKLEERLEPGDLRFSKASSTSTAMVVDFMSIIRRQPLQNMMVKSAWLSVQHSCVFYHLDIVFDGYIEDSIKEGERRSHVNCEHLEVINMLLARKIPVQIDQFWASPANKIALQKL